MATDYLALFAAQNNFKVNKNKVYGVYNGYNVCIGMQGATLACYFATQVVDEKSFYSCLQEQGTARGIIDYKIIPPFVIVLTQNVSVYSALDFITQLLALCKASSNELCPICQLRLVEEEKVFFTVSDVVCVAHDNCITELETKVNTRYNTLKTTQIPWHGALLDIILGTVIITLLATIIGILSKTSFTSAFIVSSLATGYLLATVYLRRNAKWGLPMYLCCAIAGIVSVFIVQTVSTAYLLMIRDTTTFAKGLLGVFVLWGGDGFGMLIMEMVFAVLSVGCGIALKDFQRISYIKQNVIKIKRIMP